jgi:acetyltransferase-like isoleucine patch superfamily enzyme
MSLMEELRSLYKRLQGEKFAEFKRRVPFGDLIVERWEVAQEYGFGDGTTCYDNVLILGDVIVGKHCWIGPNVILDGLGGLEIGDYVHISAGSQIYSHNTVQRALSGDEAPADYEPTHIGSRVYIGPNVVIQKGVSVGDGVIIGAMSLVTESIPGGSQVWGIPARLVAGGAAG